MANTASSNHSPYSKKPKGLRVSTSPGSMLFRLRKDTGATLPGSKILSRFKEAGSSVPRFSTGGCTEDRLSEPAFERLRDLTRTSNRTGHGEDHNG